MLQDVYFTAITDLLQSLYIGQKDVVTAAGELVARQVAQGGRFFLCGTGHSHMIAEEAYGRAGGPTFVRGIWFTPLMLHENIYRSTHLERLEGLANILFTDSAMTTKDVLMVISNSGRNAVPVELALLAKETGIPLICLTSIRHSQSVSSRHKSGKRLFEIGDIVIDNGSPTGDAVVSWAEDKPMAGSTSTIAGVFLVQSILLIALERLSAQGADVQILRSDNL